MKKSLLAYHELVLNIYDEILNDSLNAEAFAKAGKEIAARLSKDQLVYLVGPGGHSNMSAEECLCRAGMPVQLSPMIDGTSLLHGTTKTRFLQRSVGYAKGLLEAYDIKAGDVLILINAYGINCMTIDMAIESKKKGIFTIGICSKSFGRRLPADHPARHPNGKNLEDLCDIVIDSKMPYGDAAIEIPGADQRVGPTSTLCNIFVINLLMLQAVEEMIGMGCNPKIWRSINLPGGDEFNKEYFAEYGQRIRYLL